MTKKKFEFPKVGDTSKNLSRASPSPPTGQLRNLGRGFSFYTRPFRSFNIGYVDLQITSFTEYTEKFQVK